MPIHPYDLVSVWNYSLVHDSVVLDWEAGLTNQLGGTTRCQKTDIILDKSLCKIEETSLVEDRQDGCFVSVLQVSEVGVIRPYQSSDSVRSSYWNFYCSRHLVHVLAKVIVFVIDCVLLPYFNNKGCQANSDGAKDRP